MSALLKERAVSYQNDLKYSYMVLKLTPEDVISEYQLRMIQENPDRQLLSLHKKQIDKDIYIFYDITSKITLSQLLKRTKVNKHEFLSILKSLIRSIGLCKQYLLSCGSFILHNDYIYIDPATLELSIAYLPVESDADINQELKALLTDLLVYKTSFKTSSEGDFVYELLSFLKSESFSINQLDKLIAEIALQQHQNNKTNASPKESHVPKSFEDDETIKKTDTRLSSLIFVLLQLFFAAISFLLIRYYYFQAESLDASKAIGIIIIAAALDYLVIKQLKLKKGPVLHRGKAYKKYEETSPVSALHRLLEGMKKSKQAAAHKKASDIYKFEKEPKVYIEPKYLETNVLSDGAPKLACLKGFGENSQENIYIDKPSFIIGRISSRVDYISANAAVGKLHAEITLRDGAYYIKDLNSRNGTYINGERIVSNVEHPIKSYDRIAFANSEYKFLQS